MPIVLITNPKGGCGKSTAATNLAGYFAWRGHPTMLGDLDRQQSALAWLGIRPTTLPHIRRGKGFPPFPIRMSIFQDRHSTRDPLRPFRMAGARIFQAA